MHGTTRSLIRRPLDPKGVDLNARRGLRVLIVHEAYQYRGGEDIAVATDAEMLTERGHTVERWMVDNAEISRWSSTRKAALLWRTTWSGESYRQLSALAARFRPDVIHFHNTLPIISPSAIVAAHRLGLPVVMTLHNYRLLCPVGTFMRDGKICEECQTRSLMRGIVHRCYRGSAVQTGAVAMMLAAHRRMGTWRNGVDAYVVLTEFMRAKMVEGGLPADRLHVRPTPIKTRGTKRIQPGDSVLFVGRLSSEKGVGTLLEMSRLLKSSTVRIAGTGPLRSQVLHAADASSGKIEYLGELDHDAILDSLAQARVLVFPSMSYEGFGLVLLEAMALGVPVVASRIGGVPEMISDGVEGFLVQPGDAPEFARRVNQLLSDNPLNISMGAAGAKKYHANYSTALCYSRLMGIYDAAIRSTQRKRAQ